MSFGRSRDRRYTRPNRVNTSVGFRFLKETKDQRTAREAAEATAEDAKNRRRLQAHILAEHKAAREAFTLPADALEKANAARAPGEPTLQEFAQQLKEDKGYPRGITVDKIVETILLMRAEHAAEDAAKGEAVPVASLEERLGLERLPPGQALVSQAHVGQTLVRRIREHEAPRLGEYRDAWPKPAGEEPTRKSRQEVLRDAALAGQKVATNTAVLRA